MKKTKKMMAGVLAMMSTSLVACSSQDIPAEPIDEDCDDWDWDKNTQTYYCDDESSRHYSSYYHGGRYYKNKSTLLNSSEYKDYKNSIKTGIGSGSKGGFGG